MKIKKNLRQSYNNIAIERDKHKLQEWKIKPRDSFLELLINECKSTQINRNL